MLESNVQSLATVFKERWQARLSVSPHYALDQTWPSVALLDYLALPLRGLLPADTTLPKEAQHLLDGMSAYLALVARGCWEQIAEKVRIFKDSRGIVIEATGGPFLSDKQKAHCVIQEKLQQLLLGLPNPMPVIGKHTQAYDIFSNVLEIFGLGLCSGQGPFVEGPWSHLSLEQFSAALEKINKHLSGSCAQHYAQLFPDEPLGQVPELYLGGLVLPPLNFEERSPALRAGVSLLEFFRDYRVPEGTALEVAKNLCLSPSQQISSAALAYYVALTTEAEVPQEIISAARAKGEQLGPLWRTVQSLRERLQLGGRWLEEGLSGSDSRNRFELESVLGFIPWIVISAETLQDRSFFSLVQPLLRTLAQQELDESEKLVTALIEKSSDNFALRLQQVQLALVRGDAEKAETLCKSLVGHPQSDASGRYYFLWGIACLAQGKKELALRMSKAGIPATERDLVLRADLANNIAWCLLLLERLDEALEYLDLALQSSQYTVTPKLNKAYILSLLQRQDEAATIYRELFVTAPMDRRVFSCFSHFSSPLQEENPRTRSTQIVNRVDV